MYLDLLFLLCLFIHYFLLLFTAKLFQRRPGFWRLLAGAALGALAVPVNLLPPSPAVTLTVILAVPLAMLCVVFRPLPVREIPLLWVAFFLLSFMTGGAALALFSMTGPGGGGPFRGIAVLFAVCLLLYLLLGLLRPYLEEKKWQKACEMTLHVAWRGKETVVPAFLDTGNRLKDPFSQLPVIVINFRSLEEMLPPAVYRGLSDASAEPWTALQELDDFTLARCFTLVPFRGVGHRREMLLGLRPDEVSVSIGEQCRHFGARAVLGLARHGFGPVAEYQALLPLELVKAG
jgi:stage II sporulation protein GA (sporulation sigma-E factor processing peptidase)